VAVVAGRTGRSAVLLGRTGRSAVLLGRTVRSAAEEETAVSPAVAVAP
jgi:hypothetical protein